MARDLKEVFAKFEQMMKAVIEENHQRITATEELPISAVRAVLKNEAEGRIFAYSNAVNILGRIVEEAQQAENE